MDQEIVEVQEVDQEIGEVQEVDQVVSEHVLEIRYKPDSKVLDYRGQLASALSNDFKLSEWRITQNRVDVYDKEQSTRVFASFRNAGAVVRNPPDSETFPNLTGKFIQFLAEQKPYRKKFPLLRLGVRSRFGFASSHSFPQLVERYLRRIVDIRPEVIDSIGARLIDVGVPVNFEADLGQINSNTGPMEREQLSSFFGFHLKDRLPDVALYVEFDYWLKTEKDTGVAEIVSIVRDYASSNWRNSEFIRDLVMGD